MKKGISWLLKGKRKFVILTFLVISVISGVVILKSIKSMNVASHTEKGGGRTVAAFEHCLFACVIQFSERDGRHDYARCAEECAERQSNERPGIFDILRKELAGTPFKRKRQATCLHRCTETDEDKEKLVELLYECGGFCN